jgi:dsDNA-specific endonuclease/ATPase MutS2
MSCTNFDFLLHYQQLVKPIQSKQPEIPAAEHKYKVAVQTSRNTLDLRGCQVEDSLQELDRALAS